MDVLNVQDDLGSFWFVKVEKKNSPETSRSHFSVAAVRFFFFFFGFCFTLL